MMALGNATLNAIYEARPSGTDFMGNALTRPTPRSTRAEREAYIVAKYERRQFANPEPVPGLSATEVRDAGDEHNSEICGR